MQSVHMHTAQKLLTNFWHKTCSLWMHATNT